MALPSALKPIKPFIKRAEEVEKSSNESGQIVAYYCRQYALQKALELKVNSEEGVEAFLLSMMDGLEAKKKELGVTKEAGQTIVRNFSLGVFKKADDEYRAGLATKATPRSFYAAGTFLEVNKVFDGGDHKLDNLRKYAKLKATEIILAIKQGKKPIPADMEKEEEEQEEEEEDEEEEQVPTTVPKIVSKPKVVQEEDEDEDDREPAPMPKEALSKKKRRQTRLRPRGTAGTPETKQAEEFSRKAVRALQSSKFQEAANFLSEALSVLESRKPKPRVDGSNISEKTRDDSLEYALFATRALECIGESIDLDDGVDLAVNHLSDALTLLEA